MKGLLKKNQIIIYVIAIMLMTAGYLNYTANQKNDTIPTSIGENGIDYAGIGDAKLVSSNAVEEEDKQEALVPNNEIQENIIVEENQNERK